ncbi:dihydrofolate reductase family protein, partial [Actinomadura adrarensis]
MTDRPYVLLSCAMSVDGYIDDASPERLRLSSPADFDRVDGVRASCDAIL